MDIETIFRRLQHLQAQTDGPLYLSGQFPCKWEHPFLPLSGGDNNIFVTLTILHILQGLPLNRSKKAILTKIKSPLPKFLESFKNKDGLLTYNYWPTKRRVHFPNSIIFQHLRRFDIGDDLDDTALAFLVMERTQVEAKQLHLKMAAHCNGEKRLIVNTFPKMRHLPAYSTWFGTENMPIEFDFCVFCNVLAFVDKYDLQYNERDQACLSYIKYVLNHGLFESEPYEVSRNYAKTSLILYHFARFQKTHKRNNLQNEKRIILRWILSCFDRFGRYEDQILLLITFLKLGGELNYKFQSAVSKVNSQQVPQIDFFIAGMLGTQEKAWLKPLARSKWSHIRYSSEAINLAILIEAHFCLNQG